MQGGIRNNFCNDLYVRTTLVLRYDLRIIAFALMHITLPVMFPDIGRPKADHDKVSPPLPDTPRSRLCSRSDTFAGSYSAHGACAFL